MARLRKIAATGLAASALLVAFGGSAATASDTVATFEITSAGGLAVSVPAGDATTPLDLGSVASGTTSFTPTLGSVSVTDSRNELVAAWTATATGTHFDLQGASATPETDPNQRVLNTAVLYTATPTVDSGTGTATPTAGTLGVGSTIVFAGTGSNTVSWNPTLGFTLLPTQITGTYQGTVTHSVS